MNNTIINSVFCFVLIILLTGCHNKKNDIAHSGNYPIIIDISEAFRNQVDYKLSDIVDSITYIPIESIIGDYVTYIDVNMLRISKSYILTENYRGGGDLVCYDRNGRFLKKLAQRGQGPGEYSRIGGIAIDEKNEIVYVQDKRKTYKYNLEGIFLDVIDVIYPVDIIAVNPSGQLLVHFPNWNGDLKYSCLLFDHKGDTVNLLQNNIFYENTGRDTWSQEGICYIYNDMLHVKDKCDTLFMVEDDSFKPKYVFKTGENHSGNITMLEYDEKIKFRYIFETDGKLFFEFQVNKKWYCAYYDKNKGRTFSSPSIGEFSTYNGKITNDLDDAKNFHFYYSDYQLNNEIIGPRTPNFDRENLREKVSASKYLEITKMLDELELKDDDPTILRLYHLKKQQ